MAAANNVRWTDAATSHLLELLRTRESLWNLKSECYKDRNKKKKDYQEILNIMKEEVLGIDLSYIKAKIQGLRTTYREEVRKVKKSESTGSGVKDIYIPKWRFFEECSFLEDIIISNRGTLSNVVATEPARTAEEDHGELDGSGQEDATPPTENPQLPKRKKSNQWMETAATALNELAKGAKVPEKVDDEWDIFGRDVANSIRGISNNDLRRRLKYNIQSAIFQTTEQEHNPQAPSICRQAPMSSTHLQKMAQPIIPFSLR